MANPRLIYLPHEAPGKQVSVFRLGNILSYRLFRFLAGFVVAGFLFAPTSAHAGILSFLFNDTHLKKQETAPNSQNVILPQAIASGDPFASARGGGDITVVGDSALLPDVGPLGTIADIEDGVPTSTEISIYTVHKGDTLSAIARMFGVSVNTIIWANDLQRRSISEGQTLVILPISGLQYAVKAGDTIEKIATRFKASAQEIATFNGLSSGHKLVIGDTLIIPDGEIVVPAVPRRSTNRWHASASGPSYEGYYRRPLIGGMKTQGLHGYNGIDLASYYGAPVYASASGDVIIARAGGWNGGYGSYLVVTHENGTQTLYGHLSGVTVESGWHVAQGQLVGYLGNTGRSTGPHLHFEIRGAKNPF